jgi:polyphosphate kinase 2
MARREKTAGGNDAKPDGRLKRKKYDKELRRLQAELCRLQDWVKHKGLRVIVVFEGRDAAGKGGTIRAITERVSPRVFRVVALPAPSDREKSQMYMQRYLPHFPAAGEVVIFDRSWYNRAGVEYVMGFCSKEQHRRFLELCPLIEKFIVDGGIQLIKIWLEVSDAEQKRRFEARIDDPLRQWKLSPTDLPSRERWFDYSRARDLMLEATDTKHAPWHILRSDDKRRAPQLHRAPADAHPLQEGAAREGEAPHALHERRLRRPGIAQGSECRARPVLRNHMDIRAENVGTRDVPSQGSHGHSGGHSAPLGATPTRHGVNFSVFSRHATGVELLLFDRPDDARPARAIRLDPSVNRTYHYWHACVPDIRPGQIYGYRVEGPRDPTNGMRFDPTKVLLDPYGRGVVVPARYSRDAASKDGDNTATAMKSVVVDPSAYDWERDRPLRRPSSRTIVYEMHVRGFTRHPSSGVGEQVQGTFAGMIEKIPYLQELGITAVELLPVFQFDAQDCAPGRVNYWGYAPVSFFAPHAAYSARRDPMGPVDEFRDLVKALHRVGIEVILDVVFNHTAEGDHRGPTLAFRGLDNPTY